MDLSKIINEKYPDIYDKVAKECGVKRHYVLIISDGRRIPKRGKGFEVLAKLQEIAGVNIIK